MGGHFEAIGFSYDIDEGGDAEAGFMKLSEWAANHADITAYDCEDGQYLRLTSPTGGELWPQTDRDWAVIGMHPAFAGASRIDVTLLERNRWNNDTQLDGGFACEVDPSAIEPGSLPIRFCVDCPDAKLWENLELPAERAFQLTAFAEDFHHYQSEAHYLEAISVESDSSDGEENEPIFAPKSFLSYVPYEGGEGDELRAEALITGSIHEWEWRRNPWTDLWFCWMAVDTLIGLIDFVVPPDKIEMDPVAGGIAQSTVWLSARIEGEPPSPAYPRKRSSLWSRMRRRR